jgi:hypothetical protein
VDDRQAVLGVLERYKKAYEDRSVSELKGIWPGIGDRSTHQMELLFKASSVRLDYDQPTDLKIAGNQVSLSFSQTMSYVLDGREQKSPPAKLRMQLTKEPSGIWVIDSIR